MVAEDKVKKEGEVKDETETPPEPEEHPPGAVVVGDGGGMPEYRHERQGMIRPVEHSIGDQPEGVVEDPIVYPPDELPPALEEPEGPEGGNGNGGATGPSGPTGPGTATKSPAPGPAPATPGSSTTPSPSPSPSPTSSRPYSSSGGQFIP